MTERPTLRVRVDLSHPIHLDEQASAAARERCRELIVATARSLGLDLEPLVSVTQSADPSTVDPIHIAIEQRSLRFAQEDLATDLVLAARNGVCSGDFTRTFPELVAELDTAQQTELVGGVCAQVLAGCPEALVTADVARGWAQSDIDAFALDALARVVSAGVSVEDRETVQGLLRQQHQGNALDAAEVVIDELAAPTVTLRVARTYLESLVREPPRLDSALGHNFQEAVSTQLGFALPAIHISLDEQMPDWGYAFDVNQLRGRTHAGFHRDLALVPDSAEAHVPMGRLRNPIGEPFDLVPAADVHPDARASSWDAGEFLLLMGIYDLLGSGWRLLTCTRIRAAFADFCAIYERTAAAIEQIGWYRVCRALRELLRAGLPIRQEFALLGAVSAWDDRQDADGPDDPLAEHLRRQWPLLRPSLGRTDGVARPMQLSTSLEAAFDATPDDVRVHDRFLAELAAARRASPSGSDCVVTARRHRGTIANVTRDRFPRVLVVSYDELIPMTALEPQDIA